MITNYTVTLYKNLNYVFSNLKYDLKNNLNWLKTNSMKTNPGKFQFMVLGFGNIAPLNLNVMRKIVRCSSEVKLLEITTDNRLRFKKHIKDL